MKYATPENYEKNMQLYLNYEWILECSLCACVFLNRNNLLNPGESKNVQEETLSEATDEPKDDKKWLRNHLLLLLF